MLTIGSLKKLVEWLNDGLDTSKPEQKTSPRIKIMVFNKRLARQISKMEIKEKIAKKKAIEERQEGNLPGAKLHMKNSLQYRKWAHATEKFRMQIEGVEMKLEQAQMMSNFTGLAEDIVGTLQGLQQQVKMPEISKMLADLDFGFGTLDSVMAETSSQLELTDDAGSTAVSEQEVDDALAEVDLNLSADSLTALPSVPDAETENIQIEDLEDEIKKLKQSRRI